MQPSTDQSAFPSSFPPPNFNPLLFLQPIQQLKPDLYNYLANSKTFSSELQKRPGAYFQPDFNDKLGDPNKKFKSDAYNSKSQSLSPEIQNFKSQTLSDKNQTPQLSTAQTPDIGVQELKEGRIGSMSQGLEAMKENNIDDDVIILDDDDEEDDCVILEPPRKPEVKNFVPIMAKSQNVGTIVRKKINDERHTKSMESIRENFFRELRMREMVQNMSMSLDPMSNPQMNMQSLLYSNPYLINSLNQLNMKTPSQSFLGNANAQSLMSNSAYFPQNNFMSRSMPMPMSLSMPMTMMQPQKEQMVPCVPVIALDENDEAETNLPEGSSNSTMIEMSLNEEMSSETGDNQRLNALNLATAGGVSSEKPVSGRRKTLLSSNLRKETEKGNEALEQEKFANPDGVKSLRYNRLYLGDKKEKSSKSDQNRQKKPKKIKHMIGEEFQADIPKFCLNRNKEGVRKKALKLLWNPDLLQQEELDKFFVDLGKITRKEISDQEVALRVLKNYEMNVQQTLSVVRRNKISYRDYFQMKSKK